MVFGPDCAFMIEHPATAGTDALFHALDGDNVSFDGHRAYEEALGNLRERKLSGSKSQTARSGVLNGSRGAST